MIITIVTGMIIRCGGMIPDTKLARSTTPTRTMIITIMITTLGQPMCMSLPTR